MQALLHKYTAATRDSNMTEQHRVSSTPAYEQFKCIGEECEMNCCHSWKVIIDDQTRQQYLQADKTQGTDISSHIITTDGKHFIELNEQSYCPMQTEAGLCQIVCQLGESYLSETCTTYPRQQIIYNKQKIFQRTLTLSCPEAARISLFIPGNTVPVMLEKTSSSTSTTLSFNGTDAQHEILLRELTESLVQLVQLENIPLRRKLTALLLTISRASKPNVRKNIRHCRSILTDCRQLLKTRLSDIPDLQGNRINQFQVLIQLINKATRLVYNTTQKSPFNQHMREVLSGFYFGLGINDINQIEKKHLQYYLQISEQVVTPYFEKNPHIIENLISYHLLKGTIFIQRDKTPLQGLLTTLLYTLLVTGLSHGYAIYHGGIDDKKVKTLAYTVHRYLDHNAEMQKEFDNLCHEMETTSIGQLYTLFA